MIQDVRLFVSIPSNRDWKGRFGTSFAALVHYLTANGIKVFGYNLPQFFYRAWGQSSCLSIARQKFVDEILECGYTHWLSLDDDMTFPMDIVDRLIAHDKDVVSCNARGKSDKLIGSVLDMKGNSIDSTGCTGIEEIKTMGGAIFLAKVDAFRNIPKPHFQVLWSPAHNTYVGEDVYFSTLLKINGAKMFVDHDTSQMISHIGETEYAWPTVPTLRAVA